MTNNLCVTFQHVHYSYGDIPALRDVSFVIPRGSLTAMVGPNGGGKSTIIKLLSGILLPREGSIEKEKGQIIGYVSQGVGFDQGFPITVDEMVLTGTMGSKIKPLYRYRVEQRERAVNAIQQVGLQEFGRRGIHQLSGGQLKRAVIARALAANADILVLDEPDASLDVDAARELYDILTDLSGEKTVIIASHHVDLILDRADHALYVQQSVASYPDPQLLKQQLKKGIAL